ncbi:hypothetical protein AVEN_42751-1 [Araneus ventricosus]|uniref:Uncharacterized protein n=1 Tax=Araneus ventricosus TaxID=182803 RepID=A0A4Y2AG30_ARAVE|nr:hypothetical protein AVEN_42751-1 [Araneus ventricosus]
MGKWNVLSLQNKFNCGVGGGASGAGGQGDAFLQTLELLIQFCLSEIQTSGETLSAAFDVILQLLGGGMGGGDSST